MDIRNSKFTYCSNHWVLAVIIPKKSMVYYLDPALRSFSEHEKEYHQFMRHLDTAFEAYITGGGSYLKGHRTLRHSTQFKVNTSI